VRNLCLQLLTRLLPWNHIHYRGGIGIFTIFLNKSGEELSYRILVILIGCPFILGIAIVGLEFGNIYMYKVGWNISIGSLVSNMLSLAVILIIVGVMYIKKR
jgi:uncharacterized membrane protein